MFRLATVASTALMLLAGCAGPSYTWAPLPGSTVNMSQAEARCDYEATAATQGTNYSMRSSLGQELDREMRKQDLLERCMRANGFQKVSAGAARSQAAYDQAQQPIRLELQRAKEERANARARLSANPGSPDAAALRREIAAANERVADLERKAGYMTTPPTSTD